MPTYTFKNAGLQGILKFTKGAKEFRIPYRGDKSTSKPTLWLVKDDGVYLMTSAKLKEIPADKSHVCYAEGFGENVHVGGDDYVEEFEFNADFQKRVEQGVDIIVKVNAHNISIATKLPGK